MQAVFHAHAVVVRQAVVLVVVFAVDPSWETTNLVIFRLLHFPEGNCLPGLTHKFVHLWDELSNPPAAAQCYLLCRNTAELALRVYV